MPEHSTLNQYLRRLQNTATPTRLSIDEQGRARGRFFNASLSSAFQAIRSAAGDIVAHEAYARSYDPGDQGLHVWKLLEYVADDAESVELDRLCRVLHTVNFYSQAGSAEHDLYLSVHNRLLAAVEGNHGMAFRRILDALELPHEHIILQLPAITPSQRWALGHVAESYRRNGFRVGLNPGDPLEAIELLARMRPAALKLDVGLLRDQSQVTRLLNAAQAGETRVILKRVEHAEQWQRWQELALSSPACLVQGFHFDVPAALLAEAAPNSVLYADTI